MERKIKKSKRQVAAERANLYGTQRPKTLQSLQKDIEYLEELLQKAYDVIDRNIMRTESESAEAIYAYINNLKVLGNLTSATNYIADTLTVDYLKYEPDVDYKIDLCKAVSEYMENTYSAWKNSFVQGVASLNPEYSECSSNPLV